MKQELLEKQLASKQKKEAEQSFARTWKETATPETHDPIAKVIAKLEKPKQDAVTQKYMELLRADVAAGRADLNMYEELSKTEEAYSKNMIEFK